MTNETTDLQPGARHYLDATAAHLDDLPVAERGELISDIADALSEQPADSTFEDLVVRLGAPSLFAAELRRSAGAAERADADADADATAVAPSTTKVEAETVVLDAASVPEAGVAAPAPTTSSEPGRIAATLEWAGRELEPIWWIVRGMAAAAAATVVLAAIVGAGDELQMLVVLGLVAVAGSITWGVVERRRTLRAPESAAGPALLRRRGAATAVLGTIFALVLANVLVDGRSDYYYGPTEVYDPVAAGVDGLFLDGGEVTNLYAFDDEGQRLDRVQLYTNGGLPLNLGLDGDADPFRQGYLGPTGELQRNVFPVRYVDEATGEVENPDAGWPESPGALRRAAVEGAVATPAGALAVPSTSASAAATEAAPAREAEPAPAAPSAAPAEPDAPATD